jgi:mono/diheme cytochrome c family protein
MGGNRRNTRRRRAIVAAVTAGIAAAAAPGAYASDAGEAAAIFNQRCTACHTFGQGVKVGPDLKGVTERRERPWLLRFIRGSSTVIASGDATANALFSQFKQQRMPDWVDLSEDQVNAILDWFAADGPEHQVPPDERPARFATAEDVRAGRAIFTGAAPISSGGPACSGCHSVRDANAGWGGTLGPELTTTYARYRDRALTAFLHRPCFPREPNASAARYLTPEEIFALKAYLRDVGASNGAGTGQTGGTP